MCNRLSALKHTDVFWQNYPCIQLRHFTFTALDYWFACVLQPSSDTLSCSCRGFALAELYPFITVPTLPKDFLLWRQKHLPPVFFNITPTDYNHSFLQGVLAPLGGGKLANLRHWEPGVLTAVTCCLRVPSAGSWENGCNLFAGKWVVTTQTFAYYLILYLPQREDCKFTMITLNPIPCHGVLFQNLLSLDQSVSQCLEST